MKLGNTLQVAFNIIWLIFSFLVERDVGKKKEKDELLKSVDQAFKEKDKVKRASRLNILINRISELR